MWKILIVEDEPFVRRTLIQLIDWHSMGFEIIGEADDGEAALEMIEEYEPDLIISDIVMPQMDGIELLRSAKSNGYEGLFVMLTCMNEFEYARQAIEYGAFGYVLKLSMSPDSIKQSLEKVSKELSRKQSLLSKLDYHESYESAWNWFALQSGDVYSSELNHRKLWEVNRSRYVSVISILHGKGGNEASKLDAWFEIEANSQLDKHSFSIYGVTSFFYWSDSSFKLKLTPGVKPSLPVIASGVMEGSRFPEIWFSALRQLNSHWYNSRPGIYWLKEESGEFSSADPLSWKVEMEIYQLIEEGSVLSAVKLLSEAWAKMAQEHVLWVTVKDTAFRLAKWLLRQSSAAALRLPEQLVDSIAHTDLLQVLIDAVEQYIHEQKKDTYPTTDHPDINTIIRYMHEHYYDNLTLKALAQQINRDEKYLSGLFVKKMGEPLIQYLQHIRVDKAKSLLSETSMPVNEIGELVGFANANYFFKIFKRWSQLTPNDYRKLYRESSTK